MRTLTIAVCFTCWVSSFGLEKHWDTSHRSAAIGLSSGRAHLQSDGHAYTQAGDNHFDFSGLDKLKGEYKTNYETILKWVKESYPFQETEMGMRFDKSGSSPPKISGIREFPLQCSFFIFIPKEESAIDIEFGSSELKSGDSFDGRKIISNATLPLRILRITPTTLVFERGGVKIELTNDGETRSVKMGNSKVCTSIERKGNAERFQTIVSKIASLNRGEVKVEKSRVGEAWKTFELSGSTTINGNWKACTLNVGYTQGELELTLKDAINKFDDDKYNSDFRLLPTSNTRILDNSGNNLSFAVDYGPYIHRSLSFRLIGDELTVSLSDKSTCKFRLK